MRGGLLLALLAGGCAGAGPDPAAVLARLRVKVVAGARRIPNYTCVEAVTRHYFEPAIARPPRSCDDLAARKIQRPYELRRVSTDRLHLEVAAGARREIYSWVGESRFHDLDLYELVGSGPVGTGAFGSFLMAIFGGDATEFRYTGETSAGGRRLMAFSFRVPAPSSHYQVRAGDHWVITAYAGTILADPLTCDLVRLTIRTTELPPETGSCETITKLDYERVRIGGAEFLLPREVRQRFIGRTGMEAENQATFSACREYRGDSTISFGDGAATPGAGPEIAPAEALRVPAGLPVTVELLTRIDTLTAAAGDPIAFQLVRPVRNRQKRPLLPAGARIDGRLMRVQTYYTNPPRATIVFRLENVETNGARLPLEVLPRPPVTPRIWNRNGGLRWRGTIPGEIPLESERKFGVFTFAGEHVIVKAGFRSEWLTADPATSSQ